MGGSRAILLTRLISKPWEWMGEVSITRSSRLAELDKFQDGWVRFFEKPRASF